MRIKLKEISITSNAIQVSFQPFFNAHILHYTRPTRGLLFLLISFRFCNRPLPYSYSPFDKLRANGGRSGTSRIRSCSTLSKHERVLAQLNRESVLLNFLAEEEASELAEK